jgi:hypothetical protein
VGDQIETNPLWKSPQSEMINPWIEIDLLLRLEEICWKPILEIQTKLRHPLLDRRSFQFELCLSLVRDPNIRLYAHQLIDRHTHNFYFKIGIQTKTLYVSLPDQDVRAGVVLLHSFYVLLRQVGRMKSVELTQILETWLKFYYYSISQSREEILQQAHNI